MKVGIVGAGAVGSACALSITLRGCAREIVLLDKAQKRAKAVAADLRYGAPLSPAVDVHEGEYEDLAGAEVVMITAGVNEKTGGATDRSDPLGRLRLLETNAKIYEEIVPQVAKAAPDAVLLVVTDPPDPLADLTRRLVAHNPVLSSGTFLDSLRFRVHLARRLGASPSSVEGFVVGEHGTSEVFLWSSARVGSEPVSDVLEKRGAALEEFRSEVEHEVRFANITIIEGNDASKFGIGMTVARITEIILRDDRAVIPIGSYNQKYDVTLSLPSILGRRGVTHILEPLMTDDERDALQRGADRLRAALKGSRQAAG